MSSDKELQAFLFKLRADLYERCLADLPSCSRPAVRAHSVQNARVLDLIHQEGHLIAPAVRYKSSSPPSITFESIGRNKATTFSGLCSQHDQEIFRVIDTAPLDCANEEHLHLLACRAAYRELYANIAAGISLQRAYQEAVRLGRDAAGPESPVGQMAVSQMITAYETYSFLAVLEAARKASAFQVLSHDTITIRHAYPTVAANTLFALPEVQTAYGGAKVCMSVLPCALDETTVVLSYAAEYAGQARAVLARLLASSGAHQAYEISRRLINSSENFVLNPTYYHSWTDTKRATVIAFYRDTLLADQLQFEHPDLQLFEVAS